MDQPPAQPAPQPLDTDVDDLEAATPASDETEPPATSEKLHKVLARAGLGSRRACEDLIRAGRVQINGRRAKVEDRADATRDHITVDRKPIPRRPPPVYVMLHKPKGYITSLHDPEGRRTVNELVRVKQRLFPVGRLDCESTGLLLMTNDGELAQRLLHPRYHVPRVYIVRVRGDVPPIVLGRLRHGVDLDDGRTLPARVEMLERTHNTTLLRVILQEGRRRQIRRMCDAVRHPVIDLHRISMGPLRLGDLEQGRWRHLKPDEVTALQQAPASAAAAAAPRPHRNRR